jgi:hypothetical protein
MQYRNFLLRKRIQAIEDGAEYKINLLDALHLIRKAWNEVKPTTCFRCFRKAGFIGLNSLPAQHLFVGIEVF